MVKASMTELVTHGRYKFQPLMFLSPNDDNFTSNLSFYRKPSFVSRSSTNRFAWVSTQVMELHKES